MVWLTETAGMIFDKWFQKTRLKLITEGKKVKSFFDFVFTVYRERNRRRLPLFLSASCRPQTRRCCFIPHFVWKWRDKTRAGQTPRQYFGKRTQLTAASRDMHRISSSPSANDCYATVTHTAADTTVLSKSRLVMFWLLRIRSAWTLFLCGASGN